MNFTKGAIFGMMAGAVIGAMNSDMINGMFNNTKRQMKKIKRKYDI